MKCPNCGKEIADDSKFCEFCGTQVQKIKKKSNTLWGVSTLILCVIIICLCGFAYYEYISINNTIASTKEELYAQWQEESAARQAAEKQVAIAKQQNEIDAKKISNLQSQLQNYISEITSLNERINSKDREISSYQDKFNDKEKEIRKLKNQLPMTYKTKYAHQYVYKIGEGSSFVRLDRSITYEGTPITIYTQSDGYGLTEWGWIPMSKLEKY